MSLMQKWLESISTTNSWTSQRSWRWSCNQSCERRCGKNHSKATGGAHAAVVTAGFKSGLNSAVVRANGTLAVGLPPESMDLNIPRLVLDGLRLWVYFVGTRTDLAETFQFAAEGKVVPKVVMRQLEELTIFLMKCFLEKSGRMVIDFQEK